MKYTKQRYEELVNQQKLLLDQGKEKEAYNGPDALELRKYEIKLCNKTYWNNRHAYIIEIKDFIDQPVTVDTADKFVSMIGYLRYQDIQKNFIVLNDESFRITPIMKHFADLVRVLDMICGEDYDEEATNYQEWNEVWLKDQVLEVWQEFLEINKLELDKLD